MDKPQILVHAEKSLTYTAYDAKWIPESARFVLLGTFPKGTGVIDICTFKQGKIESLKQLEKKEAIKCGTFGAALEDRLLATGDFSGRLSLWDLEHSTSPLYTVQAHKQIINCIDGAGGKWGIGAPEIVTGSRDGCVHVWDPRQDSEPVMSLVPPESAAAPPDCWAVAFGNSFSQSDRSVACGYDTGDLKLFDLRMSKLVWEANLRNGICGIQFDRKDTEMNKLIATTLQGKMYLFDMRTFHQTKGYSNLAEQGGEGTLWSVSHFPQNRDLFSITGGDGLISIFKYNYPSRRFRPDPDDGLSVGVMGDVTKISSTNVSSQPVNSLDWHPNKLGLGVCVAFDQTARVLITTKLKSIQ
ncbi:putative WD domain, G-beta repeat protein [Blattamonas nauphoetae]|uniref:WD domain, G-beta repeat protein n=1 Tax=Blattamonas nauphoetae TaxID=2049346 RepID=A0ABQ9Y136_9EUKA|nr:putative WD domain, G-beta repeat protein [Blattamonas nauphoetae]